MPGDSAKPDDVYKYTDKGNLVAVISNGTAVLGLGDIGAMSGKPVMEGKGLLFKIYGGVDVFDIEIDEKDPGEVLRDRGENRSFIPAVSTWRISRLLSASTSKSD